MTEALTLFEVRPPIRFGFSFGVAQSHCARPGNVQLEILREELDDLVLE